MRSILVVAMGLVIGIAASPASAQSLWGAVAYGPNGAWAYAYDFPSRGAAQRAAMSKCGGRCTNTLTFADSCGAYAVGHNAYGWGNSANREEAMTIAMRECRVRTTGCSVRVWSCTTR